MKKTIVSLTAILAIFSVIGLASAKEATYTKTATIYRFDPKTSMIYCMDKQGHVWKYQGRGLINQEVKLTIYDNHTSAITDDIIKEVELCLD